MGAAGTGSVKPDCLHERDGAWGVKPETFHQVVTSRSTPDGGMSNPHAQRVGSANPSSFRSVRGGGVAMEASGLRSIPGPVTIVTYTLVTAQVFLADPGGMLQFHVAVRALHDADLRSFLNRSRRQNGPLHFPLHEFFCETLRRANEFVPSMAGSILLDHAEAKRRSERPLLTFVATFGPVGDKLLGSQIAADQGVAGHVYVLGRSYVAQDCEADPHFVRSLDETNGFETQSLLAVPIRIERSVCGVLEMVNRRRREGFTVRDLRLLEIFSGYLSSAIQNAIESEKARDLARKDDLSGLGNDRALSGDLVAAIGAAQEAGQDLSLVFLDLDHFKKINDTHGHLAGSRTLRMVGASLARYPFGRSAAYRYGGDEFVVLCFDTGLDAALGLAAMIRKAIATEIVVPDEDGEPALDLRGALTVSAGVSTLGPAEREMTPTAAASALLGAADRAMYEAKAQGRNRVIAARALKLVRGDTLP